MGKHLLPVNQTWGCTSASLSVFSGSEATQQFKARGFGWARDRALVCYTTVAVQRTPASFLSLLPNKKYNQWRASSLIMLLIIHNSCLFEWGMNFGFMPHSRHERRGKESHEFWQITLLSFPPGVYHWWRLWSREILPVLHLGIQMPALQAPAHSKSWLRWDFIWSLETQQVIVANVSRSKLREKKLQSFLCEGKKIFMLTWSN